MDGIPVNAATGQAALSSGLGVWGPGPVAIAGVGFATPSAQAGAGFNWALSFAGNWTGTTATGPDGSTIITLGISYWAPWVGDCSGFCVGNDVYNLFEFTDPAATKSFTFDTSFENAVVAFEAKGIRVSDWDNRYNPLHDFNLRDSNDLCSFHVDLNSHGGVPTTGSIHIDAINPNIGLLNRVEHGIYDLAPDGLRKLGLPVPGMNSACKLNP